MNFTMRCSYCSESKMVDLSELNLPTSRLEVASKNGWSAQHDSKCKIVMFWCSKECELKYKKQKKIHLEIVGMVSR